jgi:tRNA threonylcarbamoyladenosine biosynthesis protein TsaB
MKILAIETSHVVGSIAAAEDGRLLGEEEFEEGMVHGRELVPRLKALVERLGWALRDVGLFAVSIGPGSYTGLRVGVATAKTVAYAVGMDVVGVPSLDVLARNAPDAAATVCPIVDAKGRQVYACLYDRERNRIGDFVVTYPEELAGTLPKGTFVLGDGLESYRELFDRDGIRLADRSLWRPRAGVVAQLGFRLHSQGQRDDCMSLVPLYLRRPQAEEKWRKKQEQKGA